MTTPILDAAAITGAMRRARALGCPPNGRRCAPWPSTPEEAIATLQPDGWCKIGMMEDVRVGNARRGRGYLGWHVYCHVDSGEVRLEEDRGESVSWFEARS